MQSLIGLFKTTSVDQSIRPKPGRTYEAGRAKQQVARAPALLTSPSLLLLALGHHRHRAAVVAVLRQCRCCYIGSHGQGCEQGGRRARSQGKEEGPRARNQGQAPSPQLSKSRAFAARRTSPFTQMGGVGCEKYLLVLQRWRRLCRCDQADHASQELDLSPCIVSIEAHALLAIHSSYHKLVLYDCVVTLKHVLYGYVFPIPQVLRVEKLNKMRKQADKKRLKQGERLLWFQARALAQCHSPTNHIREDIAAVMITKTARHSALSLHLFMRTSRDF